MRDAFFARADRAGADDERVWALTGDLGIGLFDDFAARAPGRYLNVGIAEQNLVGVAAGLAYAGKVPFAYSIAPFIDLARRTTRSASTSRCRGANVKLVGVGGGVAYGYLGPTHHAIEDLALMRALPGHDGARARRSRRGARAPRARRSRSTARSTCAWARTASRRCCPTTPFVARPRALGARRAPTSRSPRRRDPRRGARRRRAARARGGRGRGAALTAPLKPFDAARARRGRAHRRVVTRRGAHDHRRPRQRGRRGDRRGGVRGVAAPARPARRTSRTRSAPRAPARATTAWTRTAVARRPRAARRRAAQEAALDDAQRATATQAVRSARASSRS